MTETDYDYLTRLKTLSERLTDTYERAAFCYLCKALQEYKFGRRDRKRVPKYELLTHLVSLGLQSGGRDGNYPDDRRLRECCRSLLTRGYPVLASSRTDGYFVPENVAEIDEPQTENAKRGRNVFAADKGYKRVRAFLLGQQSFFEEA